MTNKHRPKQSWHSYILVMLVAILLLIFGFVTLGTHDEKLQSGQSNVDEVFSGEPLAHSLDLRVASKATFPSSPLQLIENIPTTNDIKREIVSFSVATDQLTEYALEMFPNTAKPAKGYPVIILCHSYVNPSEYITKQGYLQDMEFYAKHGYVVIKPDLRGQGLSIHQGLPEGAYYSMAYNTDVLSLISALKQTGYIDKSKINLWGHSMGAYVALRAAVVSKDVKHLVLLSGPVDSLKDMYLTFVPPSDENNPEALKIKQAIFNKYGTPDQNSGFWKNASPINFVKQMSAKVQIHAGSNDLVVPPEFSADLDQALSKDNIKHEYYLYPDGLHALAPQRPLIWNRSLDLLNQ